MKEKFFKKVMLVCLLPAVISSCIQTEIEDKYEILSNCGAFESSSFVCSFELIQKTVQLDTNILGRTSEKTIKYKKLSNLLTNSGDSNKFSCTGNKFSSSQEVQNANLPPCQGDDCNALSNPTACTFPKGVTAKVSVSGPELNVTKNISHNSDITTQYTMPVGNTRGFASGRSSDQSGIVWTIVNNDITFTCPVGYAVPQGAPVAQPGRRVEGSKSGSTKIDGWQVKITTTSTRQKITSQPITNNKWIVNNISGFGSNQNDHNGGFIVFSCINDSQSDGYTYEIK